MLSVSGFLEPPPSPRREQLRAAGGRQRGEGHRLARAGAVPTGPGQDTTGPYAVLAHLLDCSEIAKCCEHLSCLLLRRHRHQRGFCASLFLAFVFVVFFVIIFGSSQYTSGHRCHRWRGQSCGLPGPGFRWQGRARCFHWDSRLPPWFLVILRR